jgi:flagellar M-ring protein FliF
VRLSLVNSLLAFIRQLGPLRAALIAAAGVGTFVLIAALALRVAEPPMALLYGDLDTRDASQIVAELERTGVPHRIGRGGSEVQVPADQVARIRLALAREGLPASGNVGYEIFDRQNGLTTTPFQQDINRVRALEGEVARTLRSLNGVAAARVHLVLPRRDAFSRDRSDSQASVVLQMRGSRRLDEQGVQSVLHLVAAAVPGLRVQNIAIVDGRGELLSRSGQSAGLVPGVPGSGTSAQDELRRAMEHRIARGIEDILQRALGPGRARVEAMLELDFARQQVVEERFDPDNQVPRSQQSVTESNRTGEPRNVSVANQLPGAPPANTAAPQAEDNRQEETTNFEIGRTTRTTVRDQPVVQRLSLAVLVDGVQEAALPGSAPVWRERTPQELARIAALVRGAVGFNEQRGDNIEVVSMRFADAAIGLGDAGLSGFWEELLSSTLIARVVEILVIGGLILTALLLVVRPVTQRLLLSREVAYLPPMQALPTPIQAARGQERSLAPAPASPPSPPPPVEDLVSINLIEGKISSSAVRQVADLSDRFPDQALAVVRRWLAEDRSAAT